MRWRRTRFALVGAVTTVLALLTAGCVGTPTTASDNDRPLTTATALGEMTAMRPSDEDVTKAYTWLISTIDGTMEATGRTTWVYKRGFSGDPCGQRDGKPAFHFGWAAYADGVPDKNRERAAQAAAAYLRSVGMTGIKAAPFKDVWAAAYQDESAGVFARYIEGGGGVIRISTACYPGDYMEAEQVMAQLKKQGVIHTPTFFDPNA